MSQQAFFDTTGPVADPPTPSDQAYRNLDPPPVADPPTPSDQAYREAMSKAGAILARRAHSEKELKDKLDGLHPDVAGQVLDRLAHLGLIDDEAFASDWVEANQDRKGLEALRAGLAARGVDGDIADRVLEKAAAGEQERANLIASRYLPRVIERPLPAQAAALLRTLMGRGFSLEVAEEAVRSALPPDGWD